jgi:hypothetical protein
MMLVLDVVIAIYVVSVPVVGVVGLALVLGTPRSYARTSSHD